MLNVITLMGRLVADPEPRTTPTGISTCTFTIACERNYAAKDQERITDFFDIVTWRGTSLFVCKYFVKGQLIAVDGSLQTRSYEDKNGIKRKVYEILARNINFAGDKPKSNEYENKEQNNQYTQQNYKPLSTNGYSQNKIDSEYNEQANFSDYIPPDEPYDFPFSGE